MGLAVALVWLGSGHSSTALQPAFWRQYSKEVGRLIAAAPHQPQPASWPDNCLHATWLGHSTVLVKVDGFTILTDPVFSDRVGLGIGPLTLGLKRLISPALPVPELPPPDLILLSHAHMDHFDLPSLRLLENRRLLWVTAFSTSDLLRAQNYKEVKELRWNASVSLGPATVRAVEVNHWGARIRSDTYRGYNGYVIETDRYRNPLRRRYCLYRILPRVA